MYAADLISAAHKQQRSAIPGHLAGLTQQHLKQRCGLAGQQHSSKATAAETVLTAAAAATMQVVSRQ